MSEFSTQSIFLDVKNLRQQSIAISIICLIIFVMSLFIYIFTKEIKWLRVCIAMVFLVAMAWFFVYRNVKFFQENPYLILDEIGVKIQSKHQTIFIEWQNVKMIDGGFNFPCVIETKDNQYYELDQPLLTGQQILDIIVLLKRYAEHYGSVKFIY